MAQKRWQRPTGYIIPVLVSDTDLTALPPFLGGLTILEPEGNCAAEVAAHVDRIVRGRTRRRRLSFLGVVTAALLVGVTIYYWLHQLAIKRTGVEPWLNID